MPKNVYKPSCSLSKESQRKKRLVKNLIDINNDLDINSVHQVEKSTTVNSREIAPECSLDFSNNDQSRMSLNTNLQESFLTEQSSIIDVTQTINEPISDRFPNFNFNQNINITDANHFQNALASFIVSSRLPRNSATKLLKLLKSVDNLECLKLLPMDSRTLLSTPRSGHVEINNIGGGQYIHFGILSGLTYLLNTIVIQSLSELELWFNIDGLPINKGVKSFWPILCSLSIKSSMEKPFIVGVYFGSKKPYFVEEYLFPFIDDLNDLILNGLQFNNITFQVKIKGIIADAPARAFLKQIKGHSGYFGCEKCNEKGVYLSNSVCFPDGNAELRTDESFLLRTNEKHHIGVTPLLSIHGFELVSSFPLDYMHLCCLGIMKRILHILVRGTLVPSSYGSVRLSRDQTNVINNRMKIVVKWMSSDFSRIPSDINDFHFYKATEFRQILIYTGPYLFKGVLGRTVYKNFIILNIFMRLLCCQKTVNSQNDFAASLAKQFLQSFCFIYGKGNASYNVHSIIHLANDAKKYGVLDNFSAFPFENYLQHVKKIVQTGPAPLVQLYNRIKEEHACLPPQRPTNHYPFLDGQHVNGPLPFDDLYNESYSQYSTLIMKDYTIRVSNEKRRSVKKDDCVIISSKNICIVYNILKMNEEIYLVCKSFKNISPFYNFDLYSSTSVGIYKCNNLSHTLQLYNIQNIKFKACYLPINDILPNVFYVCAILHSSHN